MIFGIIYLLIDGTNDREYVGQTTKTVEERFKQHAQADTYIGHVIRARGEDMFAIAVLKVCHSKKELDYWERHFIKSRNTKAPNGYNLTDGGEGMSGWHHTPEALAKMSKAHKGKKCKPRSPEHIAKIAAAHRGKKLSPEHCAKLSAVRTGKKRPPETCKKISEAHKGKTFTPEHCAHLSEAKKGTHATDETRAKMSEVRIGKKLNSRSAEDRANISAKHKSESLYKNLVAELEARQMTYNQLAELLVIKAASVSEKMRGRKKFTNEQCAKLVEIFGKPIDYLLERDENFCAENSPHRRPSPYKNLIVELDARNVSYADLARLMGANPNSIARKIRGVRTFSDSDKKKLAEIFGKPIDYLLQRDDG